MPKYQNAALLLLSRAASSMARPQRITPLPGIAAEEHRQRREKLMDLMAEENPSSSERVAMLCSKRVTYSAPDVPHVFRQESNFRYLSGFAHPDTARLVITPKQSVLFTELEKSEEDCIWHGRGPSEEEIRRTSAVDQVLPLSELTPFLTSTLKSDVLLAADEDQILDNAFYCDDIHKCMPNFEGVKQKLPLFHMLNKLRLVKSPDEQQLMRSASDIGSSSLVSAMRYAAAASNESHLVGVLEFECRRRGAQFLAYPAVVACGKNANTIHYIAANQYFSRGDLILVDAGCDVEGYCSDITRTFPWSGEFGRHQKCLYNALDTVHSALLYYTEQVRPLKLNELHEHMIEAMIDTFSTFMFFANGNLSREEKRAICEELCPHHVSHYLGMDVHDCKTIPRSVELSPGVAFTIEPGVYIRPENQHVREEFRGLGMRIEDDVLLTDTGCELLSVGVVRSALDIERKMDTFIHGYVRLMDVVNCRDVVEFQRFLAKMRGVEDRVVYKLNADLPTNSFRHVSPSSKRVVEICSDIKLKLAQVRRDRRELIEKCTRENQDFVSKYDEEAQRATEVRNARMNLRVLRNESVIEEICIATSDKIVKERCSREMMP